MKFSRREIAIPAHDPLKIGTLGGITVSGDMIGFY
jgi:hypothetical protein